MDQRLEQLNRPARIGWVLGALLLIAGVVQVFCATAAAVPALDAVRFVDLAEQAGRGPWFSLWDATGEEPLYPLWLSMVAGAVRWLLSANHINWGLCTQLAAAIPATLCVIPVFLLSDRLVGRAGAIAGSLLFCTLPVVARLGAEGISDSLFLLWFAVSSWTTVAYFQTHRRGWLLAASAAAALATLTRLEGALLLPVLAGVLLLESQTNRTFPDLRNLKSLTKNIPLTALATTAFVLCLLPFRFPARDITPATPPSSLILHPSSFPSPSSFATKEKSLRRRGLLPGSREFLAEFAKAWNYVGLIGLVAGAWVLRKRALGGERFAHVFSACFAAVLLYFAIREGYLAARHLLPLVVLASGCAAVGFMRLGRRFAWGVIGAAVVAGLIQSAEPVHAGRAGYRQAGRFLVSARDEGKVLDTKGWTRLYSGRPTYQYDRAEAAFGDAALAYVVVRPEELRHDSARSRTLKHLLARHAWKVAQFPARTPQVAVYRWGGWSVTHRDVTLTAPTADHETAMPKDGRG